MSALYPAEIPEQAYNPPKLNEDQVPIVEKLHKKHGENYQKMSMDIKINKWQWTPHQCEKFVRGFCLEGSMKQRSLEGENMSGKGIDLRKPAGCREARKRNVFGH